MKMIVDRMYEDLISKSCLAFFKMNLSMYYI